MPAACAHLSDCAVTDDRTPPWSPLFGGLKILFSLWSLWSVPGVPVSPGSVPWRPWPPTQPSARDPKPIHSGATRLIHGVQDRPQQALVVAQAPWTTFYKKITGSRLHPPPQCVSGSEYIYLNTGWQKLSGRVDSARQKVWTRGKK